MVTGGVNLTEVPNSVDELLGLLERHAGRARLVAGGTVVLPAIRNGREPAETLISLHALALKQIELTASGEARIGATATLRELERHAQIVDHFASLVSATRGAVPLSLRHLATVGGNVCVGGDLCPALLVLGARVRIVRLDGAHEGDLCDLLEQGSAAWVAPNELLTEVVVPATGPRWADAYWRYSVRRALDPALAAVASAVELGEDGMVTTCRIGLGGVSHRPIRARQAEQALVGQRLSEEPIAAAAQAAGQECQPQTDIRASAEYRRELVRVLTRRALREIARKLGVE